MGMTSKLTGEITIDPPLRWSQYRDHELHTNPRRVLDLGLREEISDEETDEGTITVRRAVAVAARYDGESRSNYNYRDELIEFLGYVESLGEDRTLTGALIEYGIEDMETTAYRLRVEYPEPPARNSTLLMDLIRACPSVVVDEAKMMWPDGTEVDI